MVCCTLIDSIVINFTLIYFTLLFQFYIASSDKSYSVFTHQIIVDSINISDKTKFYCQFTFQAHNSLFKFGRQRSTMNIMSTVGEEVKSGDDFHEEDVSDEKSISSGESKVIVRLRDKKCLSRPQSDETSRVRSPSTQSLVLRGRDARGAPRWMLERSRSAFIKPW